MPPQLPVFGAFLALGCSRHLEGAKLTQAGLIVCPSVKGRERGRPVEMGRNRACGPGVDARLAIVWSQPARAGEERCINVVGDADQRLMSPAKWRRQETQDNQRGET